MSLRQHEKQKKKNSQPGNRDQTCLRKICNNTKKQSLRRTTPLSPKLPVVVFSVFQSSVHHEAANRNLEFLSQLYVPGRKMELIRGELIAVQEHRLMPNTSIKLDPSRFAYHAT